FPDYGNNPVSEYYDSIYGLSNPPINQSPPVGNLYGGHAVYIAGYDDDAGGPGKGGFLMINSWGPTWNENGKVYLSYKFVQELVMEAWFMEDVDSSPHISGISPSSLAVDETLTINGVNFGASRRLAKVALGGKTCSVKSWTNSQAKVMVPDGAQSGNVYVYDWNNEHSNGKSVTVGPSAISAKGWMLAEGATWSGFDEWVLVQNPNSKTADVSVLFLTPEGKVNGPKCSIPPESRISIHVNGYVPERDVSTIVSPTNGVDICAERAMYVNTPDGKWGAHDSIAASGPASICYLAEGATWSGYDEWVLVMNPYNDTVNVNVTFQTPGGEVEGPALSLPACTRRSIHVNDFVPQNDVSTKVVCSTPERGVVAERAMYINTPDGKRGCHDSIGVTSAEPGWGLIEGCTRAGFETWVLIQNPSEKTVTTHVDFMTPEGFDNGPVIDVGAGKRVSVRVNDWLCDADVTTSVMTSDESEKVVCERAMYINDGARRGAHNAPGTPYISTGWVLPEGSTGEGFDEWVLVCNPNDEVASVRLEFMTSKGSVKGPTANLEPGTRKSFYINDYVDDWDVSTKVTSDNYVGAERAMYINSQWRSGATDSLGVFNWALEVSKNGSPREADSWFNEVSSLGSLFKK
ncbi:MAG: IPT/TIG domain-containing protein, partial [Actinomycetota bacterium]|nr:IPT/TIG domain-containing protein [Actinomycetota bacterium]